jgi:hypothetical protein
MQMYATKFEEKVLTIVKLSEILDECFVCYERCLSRIRSSPDIYKLDPSCKVRPISAKRAESAG